MRKYVVYLAKIRREAIVVEAESEFDAIKIGRRVSKSRDPYPCYDVEDADEPGARPVIDEDARLETYTCIFCGHQDAKEAWGPGRTTCPSCKKRAPTASEASEALDHIRKTTT
jgi:hypothetical protein